MARNERILAVIRSDDNLSGNLLKKQMERLGEEVDVADYESISNFPIGEYRRIIIFAEVQPLLRDSGKFKTGYQIYKKMVESQKEGQTIIRICTTSNEGGDNFLLLGAPVQEILKKLEPVTAGQKISFEKLVEHGWKDVGYFSNLKIFKRGEVRILWGQKNETVDRVMVYPELLTKAKGVKGN